MESLLSGRISGSDGASPATRCRYANRGISLIEVLVVIGIILVLVAIILPIMSAAKRAALRTTDISNLRQVGLAIEQYRSDHDGVIPPHNPFHAGAFEGGTGVLLYGPYKPLAIYGTTPEIMRSVTSDKGTFDFRFEFNFDFTAGAFPFDKTTMSVTPDASTVLAACWNHLTEGYDDDGTRVSIDWAPTANLRGRALALKADGSVKSYPAQSVNAWSHEFEGAEHKWSRIPADSEHVGQLFLSFPGEKWPPTLFCHPGHCLDLPTGDWLQPDILN